MKKDPTEFRQRFAAWKNGEQVYDNGRPMQHYGGGKGDGIDDLPEGFLFDTNMPELTVYGDVERARRQNNWLINRGQFPRFYSLGNGKGVKEIKTPTEKGLEIVSPEFYVLGGLRPGGDIIAPITKNQLKSISKAVIRQTAKHPTATPKNAASITPEVTRFYHGSPVRFDAFNADFIGSGEGGSKVMRGINLWTPERIGNAPKMANIRSADAPLHLGRPSAPLGGKLNPTVYDVSGKGLNLYKATSREIKGLNQAELVTQGYDGVQTPNQVTVFPESIGKLSIDKQSTIEEFIRAHPEVERWTPWTTDNQKIQNIINMKGFEEGKERYPNTTSGAYIPSIITKQPTPLPKNHPLEIAGQFLPYVGTIADIKDLAGGDLSKFSSVVTGTIADLFLPEIRSSAKAYKTAIKSLEHAPTPLRPVMYQAAKKASRKLANSIGIQVGDAINTGMQTYNSIR